MQQLLYADEVRSIREVEIPETEVKPAELKLATQLIEQQSVDRFDPTEYVDDVRARIQKAVDGKVQGQEIVMQEEQPAGAQVIDLMEALRASLEKKGPAKAKSSPAPAPVAESRKPPKPWPSRRPPRKRRRSSSKARPCINTAFARSSACCAFRAASSARWSPPGSSRPGAARATRCSSPSRT